MSALFRQVDIPDDLQQYFESAACGKCFVCRMVEVFAEVRRVLRDDGTLWLNLGDSYANGSNNKPHTGILKTQAHHQDAMDRCIQQRQLPPGLKPKDLVGIPWRVALALQADGWYLRSDIIWHKPNPMPESCTDRPTKAHEYVFLLSKRPRYFFDADAVKEAADPATQRSSPAPNVTEAAGNTGGNKRTDFEHNRHTVSTRNIRTVWTIATQSFSGAHFATYPEKLVTPCVKAGTSERGCCPACGAGWVRVVERTKYEPPTAEDGERNVDASRGDKTRKLSGADYNAQASTTTTGWAPGCDCYDDRYRAEHQQPRKAHKRHQQQASGN